MPQRESIFKILVEKKPLIVASVHGETLLNLNVDEITNANADLLELRLDSINLEQISKVATDLEQKEISKLPLLISVRCFAEGGANLSASQRAHRYQVALESLGDKDLFVDFEISELAKSDNLEIKNVFELYKNAGKIIIGSYHNFEKTPDFQFLTKLVAQAAELNCAIAKIAVKFNNAYDIEPLLQLLAKNEIPLSLMGMGKFGRASRLYLMQAGSVLNYSFLGENAIAPGQWHAKRFREIFNELNQTMPK